MIESLKKIDKEETLLETLSEILTSGIAGLIVGSAVGIGSSMANSDFGGDELIMVAASVALGGPDKKGKLIDYVLGIGSANITYRIGYFGSRAIYETFR